MRVWIVAASVALAACANVEGAENQPPPFTSAAAANAAAQALPDFPTSIDLPAGTYRIDPRHTAVSFRIRHMGLAWFTARFDAEEGTLELDPDDPARSQLAARVDASSVNAGVPGEAAFDRQIANAIGAARSPQITFTSTAIERTGEHTARVTGDLSMNGQTHPAILEATFLGAAVDPLRGGSTVLGFTAYGEIDRTQWGVTQWGAFAGPEVQIVVEAEFVKA